MKCGNQLLKVIIYYNIIALLNIDNCKTAEGKLDAIV